jgi:serine/threonine-protein kinase
MAICSKCGQDNRNDAKFCKGCGGTIQGIMSVEPLDTGAMIENRYKILKRIKVGGMGAVYKAHDLRLDTIWGIKELLPNNDMLSKEQSQATDWFMREAKLLAKLDHPNIPKVTDYFVSSDRYYLVMTFIEGEDVELILKRQPDKKMTEDVVIDWAKQLLKVLDYLHNLTPPVVYRDIKPANFMLN